MRIYDGGSDKDNQLNVYTGNTLPPSTGNQLFISYTSNSIGAGKGFSASFTFGKKVANFNFFESLDMWLLFALLKDNLCDNALDLINGQLIVENDLLNGTYCQWMILAQDDNGYVTLEFQNFNVRNSIAFKRYLIM